jgi:hypothetical protein
MGAMASGAVGAILIAGVGVVAVFKGAGWLAREAGRDLRARTADEKAEAAAAVKP